MEEVAIVAQIRSLGMSTSPGAEKQKQKQNKTNSLKSNFYKVAAKIHNKTMLTGRISHSTALQNIISSIVFLTGVK